MRGEGNKYNESVERMGEERWQEDRQVEGNQWREKETGIRSVWKTGWKRKD